MFVIDVAGGDDIPCKKGLVIRCDLLVVNKIDSSPPCRGRSERMTGRGKSSRCAPAGPIALTVCRDGDGIDAVVDHICRDVLLR